MRSFKLFVFVVCFTGICEACENVIFPETLNGCSFDDLTLVNPKTGFIIAGENCGLEVHKETFHDQPFVFYANADDFMKYTLVMIDRDNPLCGEDEQFLHWMVTDIDGHSLKHGLGVYGGKTVAAFVPPEPTELSCIHRYAIFILEQRFLSLDFPFLPEYRSEFNLPAFIENVIPEGGICGPIASIEFRSRY